MTKAKSKGINKELDDFINDLMKKAKDDKDLSLLDKLRIADRAINLEKIKQKISDEEWGSGFLPPEEPEEAEE